MSDTLHIFSVIAHHRQGFIQDFWLGGGGGGESIGASMKRGNVRGVSPPWPPTQKFFEDLASLVKFDKFNAPAHQGYI